MSSPVARWLHTFMCQKYADIFESWGYKTLQSVCRLEVEHLRSMGVLPEDCDTIMENVTILHQSLAAQSPVQSVAFPDPLTSPASSALMSMSRNAHRGYSGNSVSPHGAAHDVEQYSTAMHYTGVASSSPYEYSRFPSPEGNYGYTSPPWSQQDSYNQMRFMNPQHAMGNSGSWTRMPGTNDMIRSNIPNATFRPRIPPQGMPYRNYPSPQNPQQVANAIVNMTSQRYSNPRPPSVPNVSSQPVHPGMRRYRLGSPPVTGYDTHSSQTESQKLPVDGSSGYQSNQYCSGDSNCTSPISTRVNMTSPTSAYSNNSSIYKPVQGQVESSYTPSVTSPMAGGMVSPPMCRVPNITQSSHHHVHQEFAPHIPSISEENSVHASSPKGDLTSVDRPVVLSPCYSLPSHSPHVVSISTTNNTHLSYLDTPSSSNLIGSHNSANNNVSTSHQSPLISARETDPLQSLHKLAMFTNSQVIDPKSVVHDACFTSGGVLDGKYDDGSETADQKNCASGSSVSNMAGLSLIGNNQIHVQPPTPSVMYQTNSSHCKYNNQVNEIKQTESDFATYASFKPSNEPDILSSELDLDMKIPLLDWDEVNSEEDVKESTGVYDSKLKITGNQENITRNVQVQPSVANQTVRKDVCLSNKDVKVVCDIPNDNPLISELLGESSSNVASEENSTVSPLKRESTTVKKAKVKKKKVQNETFFKGVNALEFNIKPDKQLDHQNNNPSFDRCSQNADYVKQDNFSSLSNKLQSRPQDKTGAPGNGNITSKTNDRLNTSYNMECSELSQVKSESVSSVGKVPVSSLKESSDDKSKIPTPTTSTPVASHECYKTQNSILQMRRRRRVRNFLTPKDAIVKSEHTDMNRNTEIKLMTEGLKAYSNSPFNLVQPTDHKVELKDKCSSQKELNCLKGKDCSEVCFEPDQSGVKKDDMHVCHPLKQEALENEDKTVLKSQKVNHGNDHNCNVRKRCRSCQSDCELSHSMQLDEDTNGMNGLCFACRTKQNSKMGSFFKQYFSNEREESDSNLKQNHVISLEGANKQAYKLGMNVQTISEKHQSEYGMYSCQNASLGTNLACTDVMKLGHALNPWVAKETNHEDEIMYQKLCVDSIYSRLLPIFQQRLSVLDRECFGTVSVTIGLPDLNGNVITTNQNTQINFKRGACSISTPLIGQELNDCIPVRQIDLNGHQKSNAFMETKSSRITVKMPNANVKERVSKTLKYFKENFNNDCSIYPDEFLLAEPHHRMSGNCLQTMQCAKCCDNQNGNCTGDVFKLTNVIKTSGSMEVKTLIDSLRKSLLHKGQPMMSTEARKEFIQRELKKLTDNELNEINNKMSLVKTSRKVKDLFLNSSESFVKCEQKRLYRKFNIKDLFLDVFSEMYSNNVIAMPVVEIDSPNIKENTGTFSAVPLSDDNSERVDKTKERSMETCHNQEKDQENGQHSTSVTNGRLHTLENTEVDHVDNNSCCIIPEDSAVSNSTVKLDSPKSDQQVTNNLCPDKKDNCAFQNSYDKLDTSDVETDEIYDNATKSISTKDTASKTLETIDITGDGEERMTFTIMVNDSNSAIGSENSRDASHGSVQSEGVQGIKPEPIEISMENIKTMAQKVEIPLEIVSIIKSDELGSPSLIDLTEIKSANINNTNEQEINSIKRENENSSKASPSKSKKKARKRKRKSEPWEEGSDNEESFKMLNLSRTFNLFKTGKIKKPKLDLPKGKEGRKKIPEKNKKKVKEEIVKPIGPVVKLKGAKDIPVSCSIVNIADPDFESKSKASRENDRNMGGHQVLHDMDDSVPFVCAICGHPSSYENLGDLFGPYYSKDNKPQGSKELLKGKSAKQKKAAWGTPVKNKSKSSSDTPPKNLPQRNKKKSMDTNEWLCATTKKGTKASKTTSPKSVELVTPSPKKGVKPKSGALSSSKKKPVSACNLIDLTCSSDKPTKSGKKDVRSKSAVTKKMESKSTKNKQTTSTPKIKKNESENAKVERKKDVFAGEFWVHEDCLIWTTGVYVIGYQVHGIEEAVAVSKASPCSFCKKIGATLGCFNKGCGQKYHYLCAKEVDCFLDDETFSVFCSKHKEKRLKTKGEKS